MRCSNLGWPLLLACFIVLATFNVASGEQVVGKCLIFNELFKEYLYAANRFFGSNWFKRTVYTWSWPYDSVFSRQNNLGLNRKVVYSDSEPKAVWQFIPVNPADLPPNANRSAAYFYLKNLRYKEYMYASQFTNTEYQPNTLTLGPYQHISASASIQPQRYVHTNDKIKDEWRESYMWRIEPIEAPQANPNIITNNFFKSLYQPSPGTHYRRYMIWNVKYEEPLYAVIRKKPSIPANEQERLRKNNQVLTESERAAYEANNQRRDVFTWPLEGTEPPVLFLWIMKCENDYYPV